MAALRRSVQLSRALTTYLTKQRNISSCAVLRADAGWNKDWMPDKYPKTEEEYEESARKYGLLPEDYKLLPDDGDAHGDYPNLPTVGEEQKSPWENWDDPFMKRDFGEPLHLYYDTLMEDKGDPDAKYKVSPRAMLATIVSILVVWLGLDLYLKPYSLSNARYQDWLPYDDIPKFYVGDPLPTGKRQIHYTFEPAD